MRAFYGLNGFHFAVPLDAGWELAEYVTNADPFDARVLAAGFSRYRVPVRPLDDS